MGKTRVAATAIKPSAHARSVYQLTQSAGPAEPLAYPLKQALHLIGMSRHTFYRLQESERPRSYVFGGRRFISRRALAEWVEAQERGCAA